MWLNLAVAGKKRIYIDDLNQPKPCTHDTEQSLKLVITILLHTRVNHDIHVFTFFLSKACEESLTAEEGTVQSPGYPNTYPANRTCIYIIDRPAGEVIRLNFTAFHMDGDGQHCGGDYVEVFICSLWVKEPAQCCN